jgi:hypothetical protein
MFQRCSRTIEVNKINRLGTGDEDIVNAVLPAVKSEGVVCDVLIALVLRRLRG